MNTDQTITEFNKYLRNFQELGLTLSEEINSLPSIKIPPFKMPHWTEIGVDLKMNLGLRRVWMLTKTDDPKIITIRKKTFVLEVKITDKGEILVSLLNPLDLTNEIVFSSSGDHGKLQSRLRLQCFITFSQFLNPIMKKTIKKLERMYKLRGMEKDQYIKLVEPVETTFKGLVPFLLADKLDKHGGR